MGREIVRRTSIADYAWPSPLRAPQSITFNVGAYLERVHSIKLYDWSEKTTIDAEPGDILLGHLSTNRHTVMWNSLKDAKFSKKYLIQPYNNNEAQVGWLRDGLSFCDGFFAVGGDYWFDNFSESPLREFANKITHLNMAVDSLSYPLVKHDFNPPGERRFLYIGRAGRFGDEKGIDALEELAKSIPGFQGGYICAGRDIRGWKKLSAPTTLTTTLMEKIAGEYDFFINMSRADAQATTILEAMSWGFPIACTKQSGYSRETTFFYMCLNDTENNIETIRTMQDLSNAELHAISEENRRIAERKYDWNSFVARLGNVIRSE